MIMMIMVLRVPQFWRDEHLLPGDDDLDDDGADGGDDIDDRDGYDPLCSTVLRRWTSPPWLWW